ncbi:rhodanese-like domain-containing protein [Flavobacteriaceae bacterium Ap0902]|nr:rhodanese-like domain-containing protein [Flavobacteriaceae bacterium Ap0902]
MKIFRTLIDVRANWEFLEEHVEGSINIPLDEIISRLDEIKHLSQPILTCCESGNRSIVVTNYLKGHGLDCESGGGWEEVQSAIENSELFIEKV